MNLILFSLNPDTRTIFFLFNNVLSGEICSTKICDQNMPFIMYKYWEFNK